MVHRRGGEGVRGFPQQYRTSGCRQGLDRMDRRYRRVNLTRGMEEVHKGVLASERRGG